MSNSHIVEIKQLDDYFIEIPPAVLNKLGWKAGDEVKFDVTEYGAIQIKKMDLETVELEFDDDELLKYMKEAHDRGLSFNDFCVKALESGILENQGDEIE